MHLSDWRGRSPTKDAMAPRVMTAIQSVLAALGGDPDPPCWVSWGDDPAIRYLVLVPTAAGLVEVHVRVNVPGEGPRASGKLVRWNRVQLGELAIEMVGGHRLLTFQVEGQVLHGTDADADAIAAFALQLFGAIDGRVVPDTTPKVGRGGAKRLAATTRTGTTKPAATKPATRRRSSTVAPPAPGER